MTWITARRIPLFGLLLSLFALAGCSSMTPEEIARDEPRFRIEEYFLGKTRAYGVFEDRFGKIRRQFVVDILGYDDDGTFVLDEDFLYADGEREQRTWRIRPIGENGYEGTADDIVGTARGVVVGNTLNWHYQMDLKVGDGTWRVRFDDWMLLQDDGVLLNRAYVSRWGFQIGSVSLAFRKEDAPSQPRADAASAAQTR